MTHQRQVNPPTECFEQGSLWRRMTRTTSHALKVGALEPIRTETTYCEENGVRFLVRIVSSLRSKPPVSEEHNPFLPYETALHVADATSTHVCILNKYNVVENHLLITTRQFEHQETALTVDDFHALGKCMAEFESLGFYNSGVRAGASQEHKHLQVVPLPIVPDDPQVGLHSILDDKSLPVGTPCHVAVLPFRHAFVRLNLDDRADPDSRGSMLLDVYRAMMHRVQIDLPKDPAGLVAVPYNLLVTARWMLVIPRSHECFGEISLNSLAFLGALLVQDNSQLEQLRQAGPFAALSAVTLPPV